MTLWIMQLTTLPKHPRRYTGRTWTSRCTESITEELKSSCKTYDMEKTYELCPLCGEEVELTTDKLVHRCPSCGEKILACSICEINDCRNCPYERR